MMPLMYDGGVLQFIYKFLESEFSARDIRLTFEALRLLANLLCHRCIHLDFVESRGLELVLQVPKPSVAATAVSVVLYYTAYFEDAMERVCFIFLKKSLIMFQLSPNISRTWALTVTKTVKSKTRLYYHMRIKENQMIDYCTDSDEPL